VQVDCSWHGIFRQPLSRLWNALTTDDELNEWFDIGARLYLEPGGELIAPGGSQFRDRFRCASARQITPGRIIEWSWPLGFVDTQVTWALTEQADGTRLSVRQVVPQESDAVFFPLDNASALAHFWKEDLARLKYWLDVGTVPALSQFAEVPRKHVMVSLNIPVSPERVWSLLTLPEELECWIAAPKQSEITKCVGGAFRLGINPGPDRLVDFLPGRRLKFNWLLDGNETFVTWTIEPGSHSRDCLLRIEHTGFGIDEKQHIEIYHGEWLTLLHVLAVYAVTGEKVSQWYGSGT
jgi:uncharacterized protein YndB with AHSA1/START domain